MTDPYLAALTAAQEHAASMGRVAGQLRDLIARQLTPANLITIALTATEPIKRIERSGPARSIGILNPTAARIYLGVGGGSATSTARAPSAPPGSLLVLPVFVEDIEVGAAASDLAGGDAVVFVLLFETVQAAYLGVA